MGIEILQHKVCSTGGIQKLEPNVCSPICRVERMFDYIPQFAFSRFLSEKGGYKLLQCLLSHAMI